MFLGIRSIKSFASLWSTSLSSDLFPSLESMFQWSSEIYRNSFFPLHVDRQRQYHQKKVCFTIESFVTGIDDMATSRVVSLTIRESMSVDTLPRMASIMRGEIKSQLHLGECFGELIAPTPPKHFNDAVFGKMLTTKKLPTSRNKAHLNNFQKCKTSQKRQNNFLTTAQETI